MNEISIKVKGMMCGGCETGIVKVISNIDIERKTIEDTINDIGFEAVKED